MTTFETPNTFEDTALAHDLLNQNFAAIASALNAVLARTDALEADTSPPDLSAYATVTQLSEHVAAVVPHAGLVKWGGGITALVGSDLPAGVLVRVEASEITLSGGTGTFTYTTPFTGGVLAVVVTVHGATAHAVSYDNVALDAVDLIGTSTDVLTVIVYGW